MTPESGQQIHGHQHQLQDEAFRLFDSHEHYSRVTKIPHPIILTFRFSIMKTQRQENKGGEETARATAMTPPSILPVSYSSLGFGSSLMSFALPNLWGSSRAAALYEELELKISAQA